MKCLNEQFVDQVRTRVNTRAQAELKPATGSESSVSARIIIIFRMIFFLGARCKTEPKDRAVALEKFHALSIFAKNNRK